jgi:ring-1,2-phenylacetyl-CoA epoxidase subunit PaaE
MSTEFHQLTVKTVERLTKDSVAVTFDLPKDLSSEYQYIQGQHLTLRADINNQDIRRSYSICSSVNEHVLQVGIKRIEDGLFSNYANDSLKAGMILDVMSPQGHFYSELSKDNKKKYLMLAVGSGITPMLSHIKTIFDTEPNAMITLIYGNKSSNQMMFREKLSFIKNANLNRFNWVNLYTKEESDAAVFNGRINAEKLVELDKAKVIDIKTFDDVFLCGPEQMINNVNGFLKANQFSKEQIHFELFYAESADEQSKKSQSERAEKYAGKIANVAIKVSGRKTTIELPMGGENILDAALENGADLPFSCKAGVCATCKAKVIKGKVEMDMNHSLTEQEVKDGVILTCQAHPITDDVEVDFDYI